MSQYKIRILILAIGIFCLSCSKNANIVKLEKFDFEWKFALGDHPKASTPEFDDSDWRQLDVPHDFSIEQPFDTLNKSSTGGGFAYGGIAWYRKHFVIDDDYSDKKISIIFDGVYRNSEVWINGHYLGIRPYGYSSFYFDITDFLNHEGQNNTLAVRVNTMDQPNSRWYTGAGIYRHVWLKTTNKIHLKQWGVFATSKLKNDTAIISISSEVVNDVNSKKNCEISAQLFDVEKNVVASAKTELRVGALDSLLVRQSVAIEKPILWSIDNPYLYQLEVEILQNGNVVDVYKTSYGIREFEFKSDSGFYLNGKYTKLKGVNNHHDGGPLGAACMDYTHERQLSILKEMGCNALRMSHNPPSPELLDAADRLGFVVIDEIFDEWVYGKTKSGYAPSFMDWYERDVENWVRRDRNHPSVIAWSIGNEVPEQRDEIKGPEIVKLLKTAVHKHDTTRPITAGCNHIPSINKTEYSELLDLVGYNYHEALYADDHANFPNRVIYGSETVVYPYQPGDCFQMHEYDEWVLGQTSDYVAGEFVWTGFDYLGEAGIGEGGISCEPWNDWPTWPYRGATCGLVDLCGFEKPAYWFRQALWSDEPTIYIAVETDPSAKKREEVPFWGWPKVQAHWNHSLEGESLAVHVYTNVQNVELFLNEKSVGAKSWDIKNEAFLTWEVPFERGELKAVGILPNGESVSCKVETAGEPAKIKLYTSKDGLTADRQDLSYVKAVILDSNNIPVPFATNKIEFVVSGAGKLNSVGNGDQTSHTSFKGKVMEAFHGKCLAIIQSTSNVGEIKLIAKSKGLQSAEILLMAK